MLDATSPLNGYVREFDGVSLAEVTGHALVSIATLLGGEKALNTALKAAFGVEAPAGGQSVLGKKDTRLISSGADQCLALFPHAGHDGEATVAKALKGKAYTTEQTDAWVILKIEGPRSRAALARFCPLDLHPDAFAENQAARTVMEHMSAVIIRTGDDSFHLLSASSSAGSFLHGVETSIQNIL